VTKISLLPPHPIQIDGEFTGHSYFCDPPFTTHRKVEKLAAPLWIETRSGLCCLHQQEAQQRAALLFASYGPSFDGDEPPEL